MLLAVRDEDGVGFDGPTIPSPGRCRGSTPCGCPWPARGVGRWSGGPARWPIELLAATGGNPLALEELPGALSAVRAVRSLRAPAPRLAGDRGCGARVPGRVRRLPDTTQTLLLVAAAEGSGELATIMAAALALGCGPEDLEAAEESALVRTPRLGHLEFRHPLVRSSVYAAGAASARRAPRITNSSLPLCPWTRCSPTGTPGTAPPQRPDRPRRRDRRGAGAGRRTGRGRAVPPPPRPPRSNAPHGLKPDPGG